MQRRPASLQARARPLGRLAARRASGLCSLAQAKAIAKAGINTRALTLARAAEL